MTPDEYDEFSKAIHAAGFFTNKLEDHGTWRRTCVCSKKRPGGGYTGNSFWVTKIDGNWYLGTWGSRYYCLPDSTRSVEFCTTWLSYQPNGTAGDFDSQFKDRFALVSVADEEFTRLIEGESR